MSKSRTQVLTRIDDTACFDDWVDVTVLNLGGAMRRPTPYYAVPVGKAKTHRGLCSPGRFNHDSFVDEILPLSRQAQGKRLILNLHTSFGNYGVSLKLAD